MPNGLSEHGPGVVWTHCPKCGGGVYLVRPQRGGQFWVDEVGEPWVKHPCFDDDDEGRHVPIRPTITFEDLITGRASRKPQTPGGLPPSVTGLPGRGDVISDRDIIKRDLSHLDMSQAVFLNCDFRGSDLSGANLQRAVLINCDFTDARLVGANLRYTDLRRSNFQGANLRDALIVLVRAEGAHGLEKWTKHSASIAPPERRKRRRRRRS